jgi:hypothetical protein
MTNPQLTSLQRETLFEPLFALIKSEFERLAAGDPKILWALRRKVTKELSYLERGDPQKRHALKHRKMREQNGDCAICRQDLPKSGAHLDRLNAFDGYTDANTRLVHAGCHTATHKRKNYT